jgi:hypothetical protein
LTPRQNKNYGAVSPMLSTRSIQNPNIVQKNDKKEVLTKRKCALIWPGMLYQKDSRIEIEGTFTCKKGKQITNVTRRVDPFRNKPTHGSVFASKWILFHVLDCGLLLKEVDI